MKCNTWENRKGDAILSVYAKELQTYCMDERELIAKMHWEGKELRDSCVALQD